MFEYFEMDFIKSIDWSLCFWVNDLVIFFFLEIMWDLGQQGRKEAFSWIILFFSSPFFKHHFSLVCFTALFLSGFSVLPHLWFHFHCTPLGFLFKNTLWKQGNHTTQNWSTHSTANMSIWPKSKTNLIKSYYNMLTYSPP